MRKNLTMDERHTQLSTPHFGKPIASICSVTSSAIRSGSRAKPGMTLVRAERKHQNSRLFDDLVRYERLHALNVTTAEEQYDTHFSHNVILTGTSASSGSRALTERGHIKVYAPPIQSTIEVFSQRGDPGLTSAII